MLTHHASIPRALAIMNNAVRSAMFFECGVPVSDEPVQQDLVRCFDLLDLVFAELLLALVGNHLVHGLLRRLCDTILNVSEDAAVVTVNNL
jgi:hypothetical protein